MWVLSRLVRSWGSTCKGGSEAKRCEEEPLLWLPNQRLVCSCGGPSAFQRLCVCPAVSRSRTEPSLHGGYLVAQVSLRWMLKNIYEIWGSECWDTEVVVCWCRQFPVFWGGWVWLCSFLVKARSFTHFSAASSDALSVWDVQSCWVSPPPPFVLNDLFLFRTQ